MSHTIFDARIEHPFLMLVCGATQSGKTHFVLELLQQSHRLIDKPLGNVVWFYGQITEAIRKHQSQYNITFVEDIPSSFDDYIDDDKNNLFIFDDLMEQASNNKNITKLLTKESHHRNISVIFIMQDLYYNGSERKTLLRNCQYLVLFANPMDMTAVYSIASRMVPKQVPSFLKIFEVVTSTPHGYLFIDGKQNSPNQARFRTDIFKPYQRVYQLL